LSGIVPFQHFFGKMISLKRERRLFAIEPTGGREFFKRNADIVPAESSKSPRNVRMPEFAAKVCFPKKIVYNHLCSKPLV